MINKSVYIVDIVKDLVAKVAIDLSKTIYYTYGPISEIIQNLKMMTDNYGTADLKYPLVALLTDIDESKGINSDVYAEVDLNILIFTLTDPLYIAPQRTEYSFKPILHPIYESLLDQIDQSNQIISLPNCEIPHNKIDHYKWGKDTIPEFADHIDCTEIKNMNLTIRKKTNC